MKKIIYTMVMMLCMGAFALQAQSWYSSLPVIQVAPDPDGIPPTAGNGTLRDAYALQQTNAGNGSAIYELQPGGIYYVNKSFASGDDNVVIRAAAGSGPRPIIVPFGNFSANDVFTCTGNLRLENLYIYATEYGTGGVVRRAALRVSDGSGYAFEFIHCYFDGSSSAGILRWNDGVNSGLNRLILITVDGCVFRNSISYTGGIANGRGFDFRNTPAMTIKVSNSTFYSLSDKCLRFSKVPNSTDTLILKNNTVYCNNSSIDLDAASYARVENNIFYNLQLSGATSTPVKTGNISILTNNFDDTRDIAITNNLFYTEPVYESMVAAGDATVRYPIPCANIVSSSSSSTDVAPALLDAGALTVADNDTTTAIAFKNPPASYLSWYQYLWDASMPTGDIDASERTLDRYEVAPPAFAGDNLGVVAPYDFSYPNTSPAATEGVGGTYLGAWAPYDASGIKSVAADAMKCYFDAVEKSLNITLSSPAPILKVSVYSTSGALVANQLVAANGLSATCKLAGLANGVYVYSIEIPDGPGFRGKFVY